MLPAVRAKSYFVEAVSRSIFFFFLGFFALEAFLDINPTNVTVVGTTWSVSYYVYLTVYDIIRFFPGGFAFLVLGAIFFAFRKYKLIPLTIAGFAVAFYFEVVRSTVMMTYYENNYACHWVYSGPHTGYFCPLTDMVSGHPNIPLQGDVFGFIAFAIAVVSFMISRLYVSRKVAVLDMLLMASGVLCVYEVLLYFFESAFFIEQITYFQDEIYLGSLTNENLLEIALAIFVVAASIRLWLSFRKKGETNALPTAKEEFMAQQV